MIRCPSLESGRMGHEEYRRSRREGSTTSSTDCLNESSGASRRHDFRVAEMFSVVFLDRACRVRRFRPGRRRVPAGA